MARIDTAFLLVASVCLIIGVCLGIYMGVNEDLQLVAVHTHVNLVGWASLALFSVIYRLYPELAVRALREPNSGCPRRVLWFFRSGSIWHTLIRSARW